FFVTTEPTCLRISGALAIPSRRRNCRINALSDSRYCNHTSAAPTITQATNTAYTANADEVVTKSAAHPSTLPKAVVSAFTTKPNGDNNPAGCAHCPHTNQLAIWPVTTNPT